jgi:antitoxin ParD1/3/4
MRDSLRLLEEKEANSKLQSLRNALIEGEESGDAGELSIELIRQEAKKEVGLN